MDIGQPQRIIEVTPVKVPDTVPAEEPKTRPAVPAPA